MSLRKIFATALRVLRQLRHDPRTIALILLVPCIMIIIFKYVFNDNSAGFDRLAPLILGIFPFVVMFVVTSVATLRERTAGTLDRLMTMPMSRLDLILGYALAFAFLALLQSLLASWVTLGLLGVAVTGGTLPVLITAMITGSLGMALGLFASAFARSEFQAVQFMPAFVLPQVLVCGLFIDRDKMAPLLQGFSDILPLTYSVEAMKQITQYSGWTRDLVHDLIIIGLFAIAALIAGAATLRRTS